MCKISYFQLDTIMQATVAAETMQCLYLQTQISPELGAQRCQSDKLLVEEFHFSFGRNHKLIVFDNFDIDVQFSELFRECPY